MRKFGNDKDAAIYQNLLMNGRWISYNIKLWITWMRKICNFCWAANHLILNVHFQGGNYVRYQQHDKTLPAVYGPFLDSLLYQKDTYLCYILPSKAVFINSEALYVCWCYFRRTLFDHFSKYRPTIR